MLETILTEIIAGKRVTPHHMTNGARLDWHAQLQQLTITRLNRAPDGNEIGTLINYLRRTGYRIIGRAPAEIDPGEVNSWVGCVLQLMKMEPAAPAAKQERLF